MNKNEEAREALADIIRQHGDYPHWCVDEILHAGWTPPVVSIDPAPQGDVREAPARIWVTGRRDLGPNTQAALVAYDGPPGVEYVLALPAPEVTKIVREYTALVQTVHDPNLVLHNLLTALRAALGTGGEHE